MPTPAASGQIVARREVDVEVRSDQSGCLATPVGQSRFSLEFVARVTLTRSSSAVAVQLDELACQRVGDDIESALGFKPTGLRHWAVINFVDHVHVEQLAGFLVVLVPGHACDATASPVLRRAKPDDRAATQPR
jgi:hypothetical protein